MKKFFVTFVLFALFVAAFPASAQRGGVSDGQIFGARVSVRIPWLAGFQDLFSGRFIPAKAGFSLEDGSDAYILCRVERRIPKYNKEGELKKYKKKSVLALVPTGTPCWVRYRIVNQYRIVVSAPVYDGDGPGAVYQGDATESVSVHSERLTAEGIVFRSYDVKTVDPIRGRRVPNETVRTEPRRRSLTDRYFKPGYVPPPRRRN